jgi:hypothetical protein
MHIANRPQDYGRLGSKAARTPSCPGPWLLSRRSGPTLLERTTAAGERLEVIAFDTHHFNKGP